MGKKSSISNLSGVWAFVTDSTGKNILWEKNTNIPYKTTDGQEPVPLSVCATPDGGFTVAGEYACTDALGGLNAFAAHYIISPITEVKKPKTSQRNAKFVRYTVSRSKVHFSISSKDLQPSKMCIYDASGKLVTRLSSRTGSGDYVWEYSGMSRGVYFYSVTMGQVALKGKVAIQ